MAFTKYASLEYARVLELRSSRTRVREASLGKFADFAAYRTDDGYLYARIRAISSRVNKNWDGWPSIELAGGQDIFDRHTSSVDGFTIVADADRAYGFSTFLGKPIFVDHHNSDPDRARGVVVDAKFHVADHKTASLDPYYSSPDVDPEHLPGTWIELLLEVDAKSFPKFAKAIVEGGRNPKRGIDGWSMGCDVERSECSICKNSATCPEEYCTHIKMKGAHFDHVDPKTKHKTSRKAYENCYGVKFFEISGVFDPADDTALSRDVVSKTQEETITQNPKEKGLKDAADEQADEYLADTERKRQQRKANHMLCPNCMGAGTGNTMGGECPMCQGVGHLQYPFRGHDGMMGLPNEETGRLMQESLGPGSDYPDLGPVRQGKTSSEYAYTCPHCQFHGDTRGEPLPSNCPECGIGGYTMWDDDPDLQRYFTDPDLQGSTAQAYQQQTGGGLAQLERQFAQPPVEHPLGPHTGSVRTAEAPLPQSELAHAPEKVDTLREEEVCPVCGSSMDEDTCDVCGYQEPPDGFGNPDLTKVQDVDVPTEPMDDSRLDAPGLDPTEGAQGGPAGPPEATNVPTNPALVAHVTSDMDWELHQRTAARINKNERPLVATDRPQTNEPSEKIVSDQLKPVTSRVRTAQDFIAAAGATRRTHMNHTAEAASGAPAVAKPDVKTDVLGVGGVDQASNDAASKADAQVDVNAIGGTGVESVSAEQEGVNVDQGDEHSKNIEAIHTDTWGPNEGDSLGQHDPVTREPFPASEDGVRAVSHWVVEGHDDGAFPPDADIGGGTAVQGVQPIAEQFGERVDVLDHVTSPSNNSGPTKTWTGTEGNGVLKQQDPVTTDSIARGESEMEGAPNWTSSTHIFAAFKLADLEVDLGLIPADQKYSRAAELERETPQVIATSLKYAQRIKRAAVRKAAGVQKLPVMGRSNDQITKAANSEAESEVTPTEDDSFMFGGV